MVAMANGGTCELAASWGRKLFAVLAVIALLLPFASRADYRQPSVPVALVGPTILSVPAAGEVDQVFTFNTPAGILAPFTLSVQNGPGLTTPPVAAGTIWLDDVQIAGPNDFRKDLAGFSRVVESGPGSHTLRVVLRGRSNSGIRLTLTGRKLLPVPVSASPSPLEVAVNATAQVAVILSPAPTSSGYLKAASLNPLKASVPLLIPFAVGQTKVMVPVKGRSAGSTKVTVLLNLKTLAIPVNVVSTGARVASLSPPLATLSTGGQATVTVALQSAQASSVNVAIASSPGGLVSHPSGVTVPAGALQASFQIQGLSAGSGQLTASVNGSQATSQFTVLDQPAGVSSLLPVTSQLAAGASENLTLSLTGAVSVNTAVSLTTQPSGIVSVPASITVPAGASQTQVPVDGQLPGTATVRAELNGTAAEASVQVTSPPVELAALEPPSLELYNGAQSDFTLKLNSAQPEAVDVALAVNPGGIVSVPEAATIPAGSLQVAFKAQALAVGQAQISATLNGKSKQATVNVIPQPLALVSLLPNGLDLQPGAAGSLTLTVNAAQPQSVSIALSTSPVGVVQIPASILLPAGQTSVAIPVTALAVGQATVSASYNGSVVSSLVSVNPPPPIVTEIAPANASTPKGRPVSLSVKLDRVPTQPQTVLLASSAPDVASVPDNVTVPAGTSEAGFAVTAAQEGQAQISASLNGGSAQASVTVTPAEVVAIALSPIEHTAYIGDRVPYAAHGTYTDASQRDVTNEVLWSSSNETVATIGATGIADTHAAGNTQIAAEIDATSQQTSLGVLTPPALSLTAGKTTLKEGESTTVTVTSAVAADDLGLELGFSGGGTGGLQLPVSVTIPAGQGSATFNVTGQGIGQYHLIVSAPRRSDASLDFTIVSGLEITGLNPASAEPGNVIEIQGNYFDPAPANNAVVFFGNAPATVIEASATRLKVKVPPTAQTGAITLTTPKGTVASPVFTVIRQQDFSLSASPASQVLLTGGQAIYSLALSSLGVQSFTGLASLKLTGLPAGVTAKFSPANLALNQAGSLILSAAANASTGNFTVTVEATALVSGVLQTRAAQATLVVQSAVGVTGVKGRFVTPEGQGIAGVRVSVDANQTVSDSAGNFLLTGLSSGKVTLRMDATPAHALYPIWPAIVELESGKLTVLPDWAINPPPADNKFTAINNAAQDQSITDARYPGLAIRLPAGTSIIGWDGVPKSRIAVERYDPDMFGTPLPPVPTKSVYQLYFGTPMGGIPSQPIPATLPNDAGLNPGDKTEIWYFDGSPMGGVGEWKIAGSATVSLDGKTVSTDPGGGIPRFCGKCGGLCIAGPQNDKPNNGGCGSGAGKPVTLASGQELAEESDLSLDGIVPIDIGRAYNPFEAYSGIAGTHASLGEGWVLGHDISLNPLSGSVVRITMAGNARVDFTGDSGGWSNQDDPRFRGAVITPLSGEFSHQVKFADGGKWRFRAIGVLSWLAEEEDINGNKLIISRNSDARIVRIQAGQRYVQMNYGANGFISEIVDPIGRNVRYTYNNQLRLDSVTDVAGELTRYTYVNDTEFPAYAACPAKQGGIRLKTMLFPGQTIPVENHYGPGRRVLRQTMPDGSELKFAYKVVGACITNISDPTKICTSNCPQEDSWDNYQAGWRVIGGSIIAATVTDSRGNSMTNRFNARGLDSEITDANGQTIKVQIDPATNLSKALTDPLGRTTRMAHDGIGNVTSIQDHAGRVVDYSYHPLWNSVERVTVYEDDGTPRTTQYQYDNANGNLLKIILPKGNAVSMGYTARGQVASVTDTFNQSERYTYNAAGDLAQTEDPLGARVRYDTDAAGRSLAATDPLGFTTRYTFNARNQLTELTDALGQATRMSYDARGNLLSVTDPLDHIVASYAYDSMNRVVSRTDAANKTSLYSYDSVGNLVQHTDRLGRITRYSHDANDRLARVEYADGVAETLNYDAAGRLIQLDGAAGSLAYAYDSLDRLAQTTTPSGSISYTYDKLDRRTRMQATGIDVAYQYDANSNLAKVTHNGQAVDFSYDSNDRRTRMDLPGGLAVHYAYDPNGRLTELRYEKSGVIVERLTYAYDLAGRLVKKSRDNGGFGQDSAFSATYDTANRLTQASIGSKTYTLAYDANGNLISKTNTADAADVTTYTWDARDQLTGIAGPGINASFKYDPLGRRIERTVNGQTTGYLYDGDQSIAEIKPDGTTQHLTGLGIDEVLARMGADGARLLIADELGSVLAELDPAGAVAARYAYSPYGDVSVTGSSTNPLQYTGRENDQTGLYYYRARYYDPALKRFTQEDPIGLAGGLNQYSYVGGAPTMYSDPSGNIIPAIIGLCARFPAACRAAGKAAAGAAAAIISRIRGCKAPGRGKGPDSPGPQSPNPKPKSGDDGNTGSGKGAGDGKGSPGNEGTNTPQPNSPKQAGTGGSDVPKKAQDVSGQIDKNNGASPPGYKGGRTFENDGRGGGQQLPKTDAKGNPISYKEYDVNPYQKGVNRGTERIVKGSDGSTYYTNDHYGTFTKF